MNSLIKQQMDQFLQVQATMMAEIKASNATVAELQAGMVELKKELASISYHTMLAYDRAQCVLRQEWVVSETLQQHELSLFRHYAHVYSQNGEDGIIAEIFRRIGEKTFFFVEVGCGDGNQNNTRLLLERGWEGVWIDADVEAIERAKFYYSNYINGGALKVVCSPVTVENINPLLRSLGVPSLIDFLSVDIDLNTSHLWRTIQTRSRVSCLEFNASLPPSLYMEVIYDPKAVCDGTNYFGASLKAMEVIGRTKGQSLVGCDQTGINAFFVDASETSGRFLEPFTSEFHYIPPGYAFVHHTGHRRHPFARSWLIADQKHSNGQLDS